MTIDMEEYTLQLVWRRKVGGISLFFDETEFLQNSLLTLHSHDLQLVSPGTLCHIPLERSLSLLSISFYRSRFGGLNRSQFQFEYRRVSASDQESARVQLIKPKIENTSGGPIWTNFIPLESSMCWLQFLFRQLFHLSRLACHKSGIKR